MDEGRDHNEPVIGNGGGGSSRMKDINNVDDEAMLAEVERVEAITLEGSEVNLRTEKQGGRCDANWISGDDESEQYEPYGTYEEEDYDYNRWEALINREYGLVYGEGSKE